MTCMCDSHAKSIAINCEGRKESTGGGLQILQGNVREPYAAEFKTSAMAARFTTASASSQSCMGLLHCSVLLGAGAGEGSGLVGWIR